GKDPVTDGERAVISQSGDFNHISMSVDGVARIWPADIDPTGVPGVPDINCSAICHQSAVHVRAATRAGCENRHLSARPGRSRIADRIRNERAATTGIEKVLVAAQTAVAAVQRKRSVNVACGTNAK